MGLCFCLMILRPPILTRTYQRCPYTTAVRADGTLVVGTAEGTVRELNADGTITRTITGLVSADAIAVTGENITVLDRKQTAVVAVGKDALGLMLRAGDRKRTRLNSSHSCASRMPSSARTTKRTTHPSSY